MSDFYEVDFLSVECDKSGDAIAIRYMIDGRIFIHVVDCGFLDTAPNMLSHLSQHYDNPTVIDHLVVTHGDGDHASGVRTIIEQFPRISTLWLHRPWLYADILLPYTNFKSSESLIRHLRGQYRILAEIEELAEAKGIEMKAPFQGEKIGAFTVLSPSPDYYLRLVLNSAKADIGAEEMESIYRSGVFEAVSESGQKYGRHPWGSEIFPENDTPEENNTSVVQYGFLCGKRILLTGDAGKGGLALAEAYAAQIGVSLPGLDLFQVPHHGSRHNVDTETLNRWLGPILTQSQANSGTRFTAVVSSAAKDKDHPRKCVVRAMKHRGAHYCETEGKSVRSSGGNAPVRAGWVATAPVPYPEEQEEL